MEENNPETTLADNQPTMAQVADAKETENVGTAPEAENVVNDKTSDEPSGEATGADTADITITGDPVATHSAEDTPVPETSTPALSEEHNNDSSQPNEKVEMELSVTASEKESKKEPETGEETSSITIEAIEDSEDESPKARSPAASVRSRHSLAPSMTGSVARRGKRKVSLASIASIESQIAFAVNTPRSVRTCELMGIRPEELVYKPISAFLLPDPEEREIAFKYHEEGRQTLVKQAQEMYAAVCEQEEKQAQRQESDESASTAAADHARGIDYLENLWVKKLEDQQKKDVAHIIAQEVKRQQREKEILEELERREKEKRERDEKLQEARRKRKDEHIQKVQERVSKVQKTLQEKQHEQLERIREQELKQEMKRLEFERKQEELYAQNQARAAEKAKLIQETLHKRTQRELETLIKNEQKQREAEERLESLKVDWEERMEQNRREKEEREKKRKEVIEAHQVKVEQKQRELIIQQEVKLRKFDSLIQQRDAELKKRKLEHKMIEKQKQFMVERHLRAKEAELREKLKSLEEKHQKLEENKRQKQQLVEKVKKIQYARQSNRERMKDYLYYMRQTNRIEPPDFVDSKDLKEYLEENGMSNVKLDKRKFPSMIDSTYYDHLMGRDKLLFTREALSPKKSVLGKEDADDASNGIEEESGNQPAPQQEQSQTPSPTKKRKANVKQKKLSKSVELVRMDSQFLERSRFFLTNQPPTANIYDTTGIRATVKKTTKKKKALPPLSKSVYKQSIQDWYTTKGLPVAPGEFSAKDTKKAAPKKKRREKVVDLDWDEDEYLNKKKKKTKKVKNGAPVVETEAERTDESVTENEQPTHTEDEPSSPNEQTTEEVVQQQDDQPTQDEEEEDELVAQQQDETDAQDAGVVMEQELALQEIVA